MADQLGANFTVDVKVEASYGVAPTNTGATRMRILDSPGLDTQMAEIQSGERRSDLLDTLPRMGSRQSPGSFNCEMIVGAHDMWYEAVMRTTWVPAVTITQATAGLTSIATPTTSTIVATAGSWLTAGVRRGDVVRLTNFNTAANNSINLRVKSVSALTLTVYGTPLTVDAANDTTFTLTILKKLTQPVTPVRRSFYVEQRYVDTDGSELFAGVRYTGLRITGSPDGMALASFTALGGKPKTIVTGVSSPFYTSPTVPTGEPLTFADAFLSIDGTDYLLDAFDLNLEIAASARRQIGSGSTAGGAVDDSKQRLSGSFQIPRTDLARVTQYLAETPGELHVLLVEPESEPRDCHWIYVPNIRLTGVSAQLGGDGAMAESVNWRAGVKDGASATGYDQTLLTMGSSAA